jgi:hypothetical protein
VEKRLSRSSTMTGSQNASGSNISQAGGDIRVQR